MGVPADERSIQHRCRKYVIGILRQQGKVLRHLLPAALGPLIVVGTLGVGGNILMEAWLSFLGVGARPPLPSWGTMVTEGQAYFLTRPWVCVAPGLAILAVVLGFNLLGDAIRDRLDPKGRPAVT